MQGACLAWALDVGDCHGVWGATTPRERRAMGVVWRGESVDEPEMAEVLRIPAPRLPMSESIRLPMADDCIVRVAS